jgi:two-component system alkaline phosphatase synthesis response regulator PhoP
MAELLARVEAQLRRTATTSISASGDLESYRFGSILVDFQRTEVTRGGEKIELSAREFKLLEYMIRCRGKVLTRNHILDDVWGQDVNVTTRTVDVHIAWLRQKLEENARYPQFIQTVHGLGYKFVG